MWSGVGVASCLVFGEAEEPVLFAFSSLLAFLILASDFLVVLELARLN